MNLQTKAGRMCFIRWHCHRILARFVDSDPEEGMGAVLTALAMLNAALMAERFGDKTVDVVNEMVLAFNQAGLSQEGAVDACVLMKELCEEHGSNRN